MKVNEILDLSGRAYQAIGRPVLAAVAVPCLFCMAGFAFFWSYAFPAIWTTRDPSSTTGQLGEALVAVLLGLFVAAPLFVIGASYASVITSSMVSDFMLGNVPDVEVAKRSALRRLPSLVWLFVRQLLSSIVFFLVSLGLLMISALMSESNADALAGPALLAALATFGIVVGLAWAPYCACRFGLAPAAMLAENVGVSQAMKRSVSLLKRDRGVSGGYEALINGIVLITLLYLVGAWGLMGLAAEMGVGTFLADRFVGSGWADLLTSVFGYLPWFLVIWVTIPLWSTICTITYFERRVRKEGFDIEVLAQDVRQSDKSHRFQL